MNVDRLRSYLFLIHYSQLLDEFEKALALEAKRVVILRDFNFNVGEKTMYVQENLFEKPLPIQKRTQCFAATVLILTFRSPH